MAAWAKFILTLDDVERLTKLPPFGEAILWRSFSRRMIK